MEELLLKRFYQIFWGYIAFCIAILFVAVLVIILRNKIINHYENPIVVKIIMYCFLFAFLVLEIVFVIKLIPFRKDIKIIQQEKFETITGTVLKYTNIGEGNNPDDPVQLKPLIRNDITKEEIILNVVGTKLGYTYIFLYLPNTRIAIIIPDD